MPQQVPAHQRRPQPAHVPVVPALPPARPVQHLYRLHKVAVPAVLIHAAQVNASQQEVEAVKLWGLAVALVNPVVSCGNRGYSSVDTGYERGCSRV